SAKMLGPPRPCGDLVSYACERRVFAPEIRDSRHWQRECVAEGCLEVDVLQFDTSAMRDSKYVSPTARLHRAGSTTTRKLAAGAWPRRVTRWWSKAKARPLKSHYRTR